MVLRSCIIRKSVDRKLKDFLEKCIDLKSKPHIPRKQLVPHIQICFRIFNY